MITIIVCMAVGLAAQFFFIKKQGEFIGSLKTEIKIRKEIQKNDDLAKHSLNELALSAFESLMNVPGMEQIAAQGVKFHKARQKDYAPKTK